MRLRNVIFFVKDIDQSKNFYKELGFKVSQDSGKFISYETDTENLYFSIMESDSPEKEPGRQVCVFWTEDIETLFRKIKKLRVKLDTELYEAPFGRTFSIKDIDGNKIEFVQS